MRIHLAEPNDSPAVAAVLAELSQAGRVTDLQRALANSPGAARVYVAMSRHLRTGSGLDNQLREVVILRVQQHVRGEYEWRRHVPAALAAGVGAEQIRALANWPARPELYSERQRAGLALTDAYVTRADIGAVRPAVAALFDPSECAELGLLIGFYLLGGALIQLFDLIDGDTAEAAPLPLDLVTGSAD